MCYFSSPSIDRQAVQSRPPRLPQGLTSWEVQQYVVKTRLRVTHTSRHMHTHIGNIYPKPHTINLQHTPFSIQCLGICMSHAAAAAAATAFLLKLALSSLIL